MRTVPTEDGRSVTVREAGDPNGVPVLAIGGTPGSSLFHPPHVRDAETRGIRLVSYDRPGYGASTRHVGRTVADCAHDVAAVFDALGIDRFCVWGISGGGPHALALAALLPERVAAAASLAALAPFGADGLDFYAGMGELNVEEFKAVLESEEAHRAKLERDRKDFFAASPAQLVEIWRTLLGPADLEVLSERLAASALEDIREALRQSVDGWFDEDVAFARPWGFDLCSIRVPVLLWQGEQDRFVPFDHGVWLAEHIPGVEAHLSPDDGHLTLGERRVPEVHAWLLERY
jgi:pimeloyl-ACP methyl ester carboxylesterase